jgi:hypothetical protein
MGKIKSREQRRAAFMEIAGKMYAEMEDWYEAHPRAIARSPFLRCKPSKRWNRGCLWSIAPQPAIPVG